MTFHAYTSKRVFDILSYSVVFTIGLIVGVMFHA